MESCPACERFEQIGKYLRATVKPGDEIVILMRHEAEEGNACHVKVHSCLSAMNTREFLRDVLRTCHPENAIPDSERA